MESSSSLPREIQAIIKEAVPKALKLYAELKAKEKSAATLRNHIDSNSLPKSIQLKVCLSIPKCVEDNQASHHLVEAAKQEFKDALEQFQRVATTQMRVIAELAVENVSKQLLAHLSTTDDDIIIFYYRFLKKFEPNKAHAFQTTMLNYPEINEEELTNEVTETISFIKAWRNDYLDALRIKLAHEVQSEINNEKKQRAKESAEDVIMADQNNELVRDLIRRELKPIKDTVQRLNKSTVDQSSSTGKQKDSRPNSKVSWQKKPPNEQAAAKDGNNGREKQHKQKGKQHTRQERGRSKSPRSKSPAKDRSPSPAPKSILKKQSTPGRRHAKTRSGSSNSRTSRN